MIGKMFKVKKKLILEYDAYKKGGKKKSPQKRFLKKSEKALEMKCYINIVSQLQSATAKPHVL